MNKIDSKLLNSAARGINLKPGTFADQLGDEPVLLVFLRHFG